MKNFTLSCGALFVAVSCATTTPAQSLTQSLDAECARIDEVVPIMTLRNMAAGPMLCDDGFGQPIECEIEETPEEIAQREKTMAAYESQLAEYKAAQKACEVYRSDKEKHDRQDAALKALRAL